MSKIQQWRIGFQAPQVKLMLIFLILKKVCGISKLLFYSSEVRGGERESESAEYISDEGESVCSAVLMLGHLELQRKILTVI